MTPVELTFKMFLYFTTQLGFCDKLCYENGFYSLYQVVAYYRIISILETDGFVKNIYRLIIFKLKCLLISHENFCLSFLTLFHVENPLSDDSKLRKINHAMHSKKKGIFVRYIFFSICDFFQEHSRFKGQ